MRTLQEKYNGIQEGKFSKDQFIVEARMQHPNIITRFNGYADAVQILKNKGLIKEAEESFSDVWKHTLETDNLDKLKAFLKVKGKEGLAQVKSKLSSLHGQARVKVAKAAGIELDENLNEAKLTKKSLTDYRYKPTNDMDKYPYEQILRGLRVELEVLGVQGTPTAEEYTKALTKVSKNLEKDSIFYTNQLAGVNPKVDLHDKMVDATAKNTVDTFNGMKKIKDLKEDHSKNPNDKYVVRPCKNKKEPWAVWEGETRVKGFATKEEAKEFADKQNEKQGLTESSLREGIKNLIKRALQEEEEVYEMQGPKSDGEFKSELEDYLQDNQIYGYTEMIHDIMTGPDEEESSASLADFLDDHQIYGYNKGIEQIYANYDHSQHWMNQEDEVEEGIHDKDITSASHTNVKGEKGDDYDPKARAASLARLKNMGPKGDNKSTDENIFETVSLNDLLD